MYYVADLHRMVTNLTAAAAAHTGLYTTGAPTHNWQQVMRAEQHLWVELPIAQYDPELATTYNFDLKMEVMVPHRVNNLPNSGLMPEKVVGDYYAPDPTETRTRPSSTPTMLHLQLFDLCLESFGSGIFRSLVHTTRNEFVKKTQVRTASGEQRGHMIYLRVNAFALMNAAHKGFMCMTLPDPAQRIFRRGTAPQPVTLPRDRDIITLSHLHPCYVPTLFTPEPPYKTLGDALVEFLLYRLSDLKLHSLWLSAPFTTDVVGLEQAGPTEPTRSKVKPFVITVRNTAWGRMVKATKKIERGLIDQYVLLAISVPSYKYKVDEPS